MKLSEILNHLTFNELSQVAIGGYANGVVADADIPKLLTTINTGCQVINDALNILIANVWVELRDNIVTYKLDAAHSQTTGNSATHVLYIADSPQHVFNYEVTRIIEVKDSKFNSFAINVRNDPFSVHIPMHNVIQIPFPKTGEEISVEYYHTPVKMVSTTMAQAQLEDYSLPHYTVNALYAYVEGAMTAGITATQDLQDDNVAFQKFLGEIEYLRANSHVVDDTFLEEKFVNNGWV